VLTIEEPADKLFVPYVAAGLLGPLTPRSVVGLDDREASPRRFR
jgi:hypothetical protein